MTRQARRAADVRVDQPHLPGAGERTPAVVAALDVAAHLDAVGEQRDAPVRGALRPVQPRTRQPQVPADGRVGQPDRPGGVHTVVELQVPLDPDPVGDDARCGVDDPAGQHRRAAALRGLLRRVGEGAVGDPGAGEGQVPADPRAGEQHAATGGEGEVGTGAVATGQQAAAHGDAGEVDRGAGRAREVGAGEVDVARSRCPRRRRGLRSARGRLPP